MISLLRSELFRLVRRRMTWVLLAILVLFGGLFYAITWSSLQTIESRTPTDPAQAAQIARVAEQQRRTLAVGGVPQAASGSVGVIGSILIIVMAATLVGHEFGLGTLRTLLPRARGRAELIGAKLAAVALYAALLVVVGYTAAYVFANVVAIMGGFERSIGDDFVLNVGAAALRTWFIFLPYAALAFLVAVLARTSAAGIAIALVILLAEATVLPILQSANKDLARIGDAGLVRNSAALMVLNDPARTPPPEGASALPDPAQAVTILGLYVIAFVALAIWRFRTRDITVT